MTEQIVAMARSLGHLEPDQEPGLEALCRAARGELAGRLREGLAPQDCAGAFVLGCAWLALSWLAGAEDGAVEQFTAGEVSIRTRGSGERAQRAAALRLQAETVLAPYLADRGFAFRGTPG